MHGLAAGGWRVRRKAEAVIGGPCREPRRGSEAAQVEGQTAAEDFHPAVIRGRPVADARGKPRALVLFEQGRDGFRARPFARREEQFQHTDLIARLWGGAAQLL